LHFYLKKQSVIQFEFNLKGYSPISNQVHVHQPLLDMSLKYFNKSYGDRLMKTKQKVFNIILQPRNFSIFGSRRTRSVYNDSAYNRQEPAKDALEIPIKTNRNSVLVPATQPVQPV
jgi:hypothetical protein